MLLEISNLIGPNCITATDGQNVYHQIYPILSKGSDIELDFDSVRIVASPFLNAAIGQLLRDLDTETLNQHLKISNLSLTARPILQRVIANAKEYYGNEVVRVAVDQTLQELGDKNDDDD